MKRKYIEAEEFCDFKENHKLMVKSLNHNMSGLTKAVNKIQINLATITSDAKWLKRIINWQFGLFAALIVAVVGTIITLLIGFFSA